MLDWSAVLNNLTNMLASASYKSIRLPGSFILARDLIKIGPGARLEGSLNEQGQFVCLLHSARSLKFRAQHQCATMILRYDTQGPELAFSTGALSMTSSRIESLDKNVLDRYLERQCLEHHY